MVDLKEKKNFFNIAYVIGILIIITLFFMEPHIKISLLAIEFSFLYLIIMLFENRENNSRNDIIRKEEREIKLIGDRIYLFYIPLQNLLTIHDENVIDNTKQRLIHEIKGHKHLAKPEIRSLLETYFETYLQGNDESKKVSKEKLSDMASRDLEMLQKQFIKLNEQCKDS